MGEVFRKILYSVQVQVFAVAFLLTLALFLQLHWQGFSLQTVLVDSISLFVLTFFSIRLMNVVQRFFNSAKPFNTSNTSLILLLVVLVLGINYWLSIAFHSPKDTAYVSYTRTTLGFRWIAVSLLFLFVHLRYWSRGRQDREIALKTRAIERERDAIQIEINSIQQQFKPHFLFNSLNSINALTMSNPEEARKMIQLLSEFMRGSIQTDQNKTVTLKEEIKHLRLYTDIEKVRFGDRLTVVYDIPEDLENHRLPALILQPLMENAIKYGLYGNTEGITISIKAMTKDDALIIVVSNPFDEVTQAANKGTGFGITSVERKMLLIYRRSNLLTTKTKNAIFIATLKVPQT